MNMVPISSARLIYLPIRTTYNQLEVFINVSTLPTGRFQIHIQSFTTFEYVAEVGFNRLKY